MALTDSKRYQLRVRVSAEERDLLQKLCTERHRGETISDLVREAITLLMKRATDDKPNALSPKAQAELERLASLLNREPRQVEEACIEGIVDLIESKCTVPLIVMETHLHLKYRAKGGNGELSLPPSEPTQDSPADGGKSSPEKATDD
ncbi:MAG: hypothetical protein LV481_00820 [Methylacidiphilales bacterium]|nr:hypothetical protein [Candidatus Methylacidiphilales bacterium]